MKSLSLVLADHDPHLRSSYVQVIAASQDFHLSGIATSALELWKTLSNEYIDLVILDMALPGFAALEGFARLRATYPRLDSIVVFTGNRPEIVRGSLCMGAFDYIIKPFSASRLSASLEAYVRYYRCLTMRMHPWHQEELDALVLGRRHPLTSTETLPPKGFQSEAIKKILGLLSRTERPLSAMDVALQLGMGRTTARRYLEHLVERGMASVEYAYTEVGRPLKRYRPAA